MPASPSMYVILLSVLAVAMNPGSKVKTPWSLVRFEMSSTSGPIVPEMAFSRLVFPVERFLSSYFVLIRCIRRLCFDCFRPQPCTAVHRNQAHTSLKREGRRSMREQVHS